MGAIYVYVVYVDIYKSLNKKNLIFTLIRNSKFILKKKKKKKKKKTIKKKKY